MAELATKFSVHGGGNVSPELSADLALEIILNEIVEQACLATGATGAAIVLKRDGEMVCRASSGETAPQLGARLDEESGVSGECIRTRKLQRCDDAQTDARADTEASRLLGVHSVMVMPLLRKDDLVGVIELFSPRVAAFGDRDERTLEVLARRVLKNLDRAAEPVIVQEEVSTGVPANVMESLHAGLQSLGDRELASTTDAAERAARRRPDFASWALGLVVLAVVILFGVILGQRFVWQRTTARVHAAKAAQAQNTDLQAGAGSAASVGPVTAIGKSSGQSTVSGRPATAAADGSLQVFENGREVFRMPSAHVSAGIVELPPASVEGNLLHRVEPDYPAQAREQKIQGPVVVDVRIGRDGGVQDLSLVSGDPVLARSAMDALKQWRFKPRLVNRRPAEMQTRITLNFRLPQ